MKMQSKILSKLKQEAVLSVAVVLAVVSAFFVHPDKGYAEYIDFRTLAILFSLMAVMAGLRAQGVFDRMGNFLLARTKSETQVIFVLVLLCFFGSMLITNDVALITFVPFTFVVLNMLGQEIRSARVLPVVCMQTIAANLGSMLTPVGNPQNLYLYGKSGLSMGGFVTLMLPYAALSLLLLTAWILLICRGGKTTFSAIHFSGETAARGNTGRIAMYGALFVLSLLTVLRVVPCWMMFGAVLTAVVIFDRKTLKNVDYSLLLTFVAFFVFIGNLGRVDVFSSWLRSILAGREVPVAILTSQVTSNVPAALLLSGFTDETAALIIGTNLGGLGTLIASMASLISYRQIAREEDSRKGEYFRLFTVSNLVFLATLMLAWLLLR